MTNKVLVIGGVAGGATFASQLRMLDDQAEIIVFEKDGTMSFANCGMPYYLGGFVKKREHLIAATPESFQKDKNIEVRIRHEVIRINRAEKTVTIKDHIKDESYVERYDKLVYSPGAVPMVPDIKHLDRGNCYSLRSFKDMLKLDEHITTKNYQSVCLVGGGFIGLEMAENMKARGIKVHLVQRSTHVLGLLEPQFSAKLEEELIKNDVDLHLSATVEQINEDRTLQLSDGTVIEADFLLLAVGIKPNKHLAESAGLTIGATGGVCVNEYMQTDDPDIYAIGDVIESFDFITGKPKQVPLAWVAHREAYVAARHITGDPVPFRGILGTAICKVFEKDAAIVGHHASSLQKMGVPFETAELTAKQHAGYYPGASELSLIVHFCPDTGKIYGAQAVGQGADKRIDVISTAITGNLSVLELQTLEIAYAPPFSAPKDPVNMIGYKAVKKMNTKK
ncbi:CoA-disulfide reductase [Jeotgalibacillus haloalkalitolerans]|uniref:CoA-disulfide reductase n=1 Tax=Jeotgalibacillus haloalkalitolerans TaxID=3104292 RepID=A0ABU5KQP5_9BACL|nr:CoA-disulfide reductase [Jeotgalibacillus sp. HH7-29]MDZ5713025.1 CoA-disulfide reductase [Jeotgalibacillus sp. HH7-29]